ncbi:hypothetical protein N0V82_004250 [Gnomoniopsis sp. IMI 355080]|nr:hypothetical protein N0V82_004250 [Gnomoniopsis sp. IMI 355080]
MPPIPIYAHSPINASKADGITPQTAEKGSNPNPSGPPPTTTQDNAYAPAQPGHVPAIPAPTGAPSLQQQHHDPPPPPTRTQPLDSQGPAPPQPGAFPVPVGASPPQATATGLPPTPKTGESVNTARQPPPAYYPPQMSIPAPPPAASQGAQRGTAGTTIAFGHPPGYTQNPNAGELDRYQRAAQEALERDEQARGRASSLSEGADGVWGSVKGAMAAAGEKIAAAEEKVWQTINKDS